MKVGSQSRPYLSLDALQRKAVRNWYGSNRRIAGLETRLAQLERVREAGRSYVNAIRANPGRASDAELPELVEWRAALAALDEK